MVYLLSYALESEETLVYHKRVINNTLLFLQTQRDEKQIIF